MTVKHLFNFLVLIFLLDVPVKGHATSREEQICGKWESSEKNLIVQVFTEENKFKAKVIWFKNTSDKPIYYWTDKHNPDKALRDRKILGMNILSNLKFRPATSTWEDGIIYDSTSGREWNASAYIDKYGLLRVRGYWHFKFIGKTLTFNRV